MDRKALRAHLFDAFEAANVLDPGAASRRAAFVEDGVDFDLSELEMDSLAVMEFCIALEMSLGVTMLPADLETLASTAEIERFLEARLP